MNDIGLHCESYLIDWAFKGFLNKALSVTLWGDLERDE